MAVALVQQVNGVSITVPFGSPPANGTIVAVMLSALTDLTAVTVKDSNNVSLTQRLLATPGAGVWCALYDYTVSGTPTATYTVSVAGSANAYNFSGATGTPGYAMNSATVLLTTLVATIPGVNNGDGQITQFRAVSGGTGASALFSNGTTVSDLANTTGAVAHGLATATASSTATITTGVAGVAGAMVYAAYTAGGGGATTGSLTPFMGVYPAGAPGMP